jgi:tRNA (cytidine/uridine-2'-O-)-methyltransferase
VGRKSGESRYSRYNGKSSIKNQIYHIKKHQEKQKMRLALFQPEIPQNTGTMIRMAACFGIAVDIIEPCGFVFDDRRLARSGMDYLHGAEIRRYISFESYMNEKPKGRLILLTTKSSVPYTHFSFEKDDILMMGRESSGVPEEVHQTVDARLLIPMRKQFRSLNVAVSCGIVLGEAMRQTGLFDALSL